MEAANEHVKPIQEALQERLVAENFGLFVHLVPGLTCNSNGELCDLVAISKFDVPAFVGELVKFNVQYVRFTAWHKNMITLYPSEVMKEWRGRHSFLERDIVGELISELKPFGIKVQLYTHPRDGHDFSTIDKLKTGWGRGSRDGSPDPEAASFNFSRWNEFVLEAYEELLDRYGADISGIYLDEGSEHGDSEWVVDYTGIKELVKKYAPKAVAIQNYYGNLYACDMADHEYGRWGEFADLTGDRWPTFKNQSVSTVVGSTFWASIGKGAFTPGFDARSLYRYLVLQISSSSAGGGVAFAAGPYSSGGWEPGVEQLLTELGSAYSKNRKSLSRGGASRRWPSDGGLTYSKIDWGVSIDLDGDSYLHVFRPPADGFLKLPKPADGSLVGSVKCDLDDTLLPFSPTSDGGLVVDCREVVWDSLDTVIKVSADQPEG